MGLPPEVTTQTQAMSQLKVFISAVWWLHMGIWDPSAILSLSQGLSEQENLILARKFPSFLQAKQIVTKANMISKNSGIRLLQRNHIPEDFFSSPYSYCHFTQQDKIHLRCQNGVTVDNLKPLSHKNKTVCWWPFTSGSTSGTQMFPWDPVFDKEGPFIIISKFHWTESATFLSVEWDWYWSNASASCYNLFI